MLSWACGGRSVGQGLGAVLKGPGRGLRVSKEGGLRSLP